MFCIQFLIQSDVLEFMYSRNVNWSLLPWPSNNPNGVGPYLIRSKILSPSKYLSASVRILDLIDNLGVIHINPEIYFPLNLQTGNSGSTFPSPMFSSMVSLESYRIDAWY